MRDVRIPGQTISLGQLLNRAGVIASNTDVEAFLKAESVSFNGRRETRTAKMLHLEDVVRVGELELRLTSADLGIRRQDLRGVRRSGRVRWYKDEQGYGRITAEDGEVLFVHFSGIVGDGYRSLNQGQRVTFVWNGGIADHGRHSAVDVRVDG